MQKWRLAVNPDKTNVIHFSTSFTARSNFVFKCGENNLEYFSSYKYLGIWLNEHLNINKTVSELAKSAGRALSALYTKCLRAGGMTLDVFQKLYEMLVEPVLFYASCIWGISSVHNKACQYFLGGGKYASNVALRDDMGWNSCFVKAKTEVFRLWIKLRTIPNERILKRVQDWSKRYARSWEGRVTKLSNQLNITNIINDETLSIRLALENVKRILCVKDAENWNKSLADSEKLRTYRKSKTVLKKEGYCDFHYLETTATFYLNCVHVVCR